jgi:flagellin
MPVSLVNNLGSSASQTRLNASGAKLNQTIQRLSSGLRINNSGDDAAGLAIANKYRSDVNVLNQGVRNANDGLSTLQIVDGGLNTISNLLDRASTLAAQSASDTFTGNRDTLQAEFSDVLSEISRQAENIGLVSGGTNNKSLTTIIGGGSDTFAAADTNNGVKVDLSGSANRVDSASLGLSTLDIGATSGTVTAAGGLDFGADGAAIGADETLTFQTVGATGTLESYSVALTNGQTANSIVDQLNNDATLKAAGISASVDASGDLEFSSANFFTVDSDVAAGATSTGIGQTETVTSAANSVSITAVAAGANSTQDITFTYQEGGETKEVALSVATNTVAATAAGNLATAINGSNTLRDSGIFAVQNGAAVSIVSTKVDSFSVNRENAAAAANNSFGTATTASTDGTGTGGADGAKAALDAISTAIGNLGKVQGTVGAGQNRLQQAIDLATSQINNFQAAESRVRDADITAEASNLSRLSVLNQAGVAALAQANQSSQAVLSLLR